MVINITSVVPACDTSSQGDAVFGVICPLLLDGQTVEISFTGVGTVTSSFVNAAFVELLAYLAFDELKARLRFTGSTKQINDMIRTRLSREASRPVLAA